MATDRVVGRQPREGEGGNRLRLSENINLFRVGFDGKGVLNANRCRDAADNLDRGVAAQCLSRLGAENFKRGA